MKECPYCYSQLNEDALFCSHCGKNLARENLHLHSFPGNDSKNRKDFCPQCFELIEPAWSLCPNCGTKLKSKKAASADSQRGKHSATRKAHSHINAKFIIIILVVLIFAFAMIFGVSILRKIVAGNAPTYDGIYDSNYNSLDAGSHENTPDSADDILKVISVFSDNELVDNGNNFPTYNLIDGNTETAWSEIQDGYGEGESLCFVFSRKSEITQIRLYTGYQKSSDNFKINSRPKNITLTFSDGYSETITLYDMNEMQSFTLMRPVTARWMELTIDSVYPGEVTQNTMISEVEFIGTVVADKDIYSKEWTPYSAYNDRINEYVDALSMGEGRYQVEYNDSTLTIAPYLVNSAYKSGASVAFCLYDVNNNGIPELLFSDMHEVIDLYTLNGKQLVKPFFYIRFGEGNMLHIKENGMLINMGIGTDIFNSTYLSDSGYRVKGETYYTSPEGPISAWSSFTYLDPAAYEAHLKSLPADIDLTALDWTIIYPIR